MEEAKRESEGRTASYESVADMGYGLLIAKVKLADIREQDINARIMKTEMQKQLTDNIKKRGQLESLPFCALIDGRIEVISGHHRLRSAKDAGLKEVFVILDVSGLRRSQVASKQIAHNAINGFDDQSTLREIAKMIDDVDDMLESYVGKDIIGEPMAELEKLLAPSVKFDFRTIVFAFLPYQIADLDLLIKHLEKQGPEIIGVAPYELAQSFTETLAKYQQFQDVRNLGATIASMVEAANEKMEIAGYDESGEWTNLTKVFGSNSIPKAAAEVIDEAIKKAEKEGVITSKNRWQLIEYLFADYLGG